MVLDPENSDRLYQQNHLGVFRSDNAGDLWERIENGVPSSFGFPMVMDPNDSRTLFIVPQESDEYRDDALHDLVERYPLLRVHLYDEDDAVRQHVHLFYNDQNTRWLESLAIPLEPGDTITVLQAVSGG